MADRHSREGGNPVSLATASATAVGTTAETSLGPRVRGGDVRVAASPLREFWNDFSQNRGAVGGLTMVIGLVLLAIFANIVAPHSPIEQFREATLTPPMWQDGGTSRFVLGTDPLGRDILSRLIHASRRALLIGLISVCL